MEAKKPAAMLVQVGERRVYSKAAAMENVSEELQK